MPTGCPEAHLNPALPSGGRSAVPAPVPAVLLDSASALHGGEGCVWGTLEPPLMPPVAAAAMISAVAVAVSSPPPARAHKRAAPSDEAAAAQVSVQAELFPAGDPNEPGLGRKEILRRKLGEHRLLAG